MLREELERANAQNQSLKRRCEMFEAREEDDKRKRKEISFDVWMMMRTGLGKIHELLTSFTNHLEINQRIIQREREVMRTNLLQVGEK